MKRIFFCLLLSLSLFLSGCALLDGRKVSVTPHEMQMQPARTDGISAENYLDLMKALAEMVSAGVGEGVVDISRYTPDSVDSGMALAIGYIKEDHPIGSYAVEEIQYEVGTNGGVPALAINITYDRTQSQIQRIRSMENMEEAEQAILSALEGYDPGIVLLVDNYIETDLIQTVEDHALENPQSIMETPYVTVDVYGKGTKRVLEVGFAYQNSRENLRKMQEQVAPVFDAAKLYVSGESSDWQKYNQLYSFLMERFSYSIETSITPSYSLLHHGVGDSRAFATVYAQMCQSAELECLVINGTYAGGPRTWNMIRIGSRYFHLDLLRCRSLGRYRQFTDSEMENYVWDYSAYPKAVDAQDQEEENWAQIIPETVPPTQPTEPGGVDDWPFYPWYPWVPEDTQPTEKPTEPETTAPTEPPTEPETSEPTEPSTEPETSEPTEPPTEPETTKPTEAPAEPETSEPTKPPTKPEETKKPSAPAETTEATESVASEEDSTAPVEAVTEPPETMAETVPEETTENF